jgi:hypothetical protein
LTTDARLATVNAVNRREEGMTSMTVQRATLFSAA